MFHRSGDSQGPLNVEISLLDGEVLRGTLMAPPGRSLADLLNGTIAFVEFEPFGGGRSYIAKSNLSSVRPLNVPPAPSLGTATKGGAPSDPHRVLGVPAESGKEELRRAYLQLAKIYHPDRFATVELPPEVTEYIAAMSRRINAAYDAAQIIIGEKPDRRNRGPGTSAAQRASS